MIHFPIDSLAEVNQDNLTVVVLKGDGCVFSNSEGDSLKFHNSTAVTDSNHNLLFWIENSNYVLTLI